MTAARSRCFPSPGRAPSWLASSTGRLRSAPHGRSAARAALRLFGSAHADVVPPRTQRSAEVSRLRARLRASIPLTQEDPLDDTNFTGAAAHSWRLRHLLSLCSPGPPCCEADGNRSARGTFVAGIEHPGVSAPAAARTFTGKRSFPRPASGTRFASHAPAPVAAARPQPSAFLAPPAGGGSPQESGLRVAGARSLARRCPESRRRKEHPP